LLEKICILVTIEGWAEVAAEDIEVIAVVEQVFGHNSPFESQHVAYRSWAGVY